MSMTGSGHNRGFTLIEVLLALAIFTVIGISTVRQIQQVMNTKNVAFQEIDAYNGMRTALSMMRQDLSQAFHVSYDDLSDETRTALSQGQPAAHTLFDGRKNELIFTSLSHRVYYSGTKECEQAEISYFLQHRRGENLPSLMKRESGWIDADLYQGGAVYTVLENVSDLTFQYWDDKTQKWIDDWNSDGGTQRDRFPLAVRVKLGVLSHDKQKLQVTEEFKLADPHNDSVLVQF